MPELTSDLTKGALVLVGGGQIGPEIWGRFIALAGGGASANVVVIPTAQEEAALSSDDTVREIQALGVRSVTVLHTRDPKEADTTEFTAPLGSATAVWLTGGRQWRLADAYLNTRTQTELNALLERGGVIGGTSAGATIQGSFLVRGDTQGNTLMIGDHQVGFGFLKETAIDQHLLRRNRQFDLIPVIAAHPHLLGLGIDEGTAIVVQGDQLEVVGKSYVAVYTAERENFFFLGSGQRYDLQTRKGLEPDQAA